jgi:TPR repeat protein
MDATSFLTLVYQVNAPSALGIALGIAVVAVIFEAWRKWVTGGRGLLIALLRNLGMRVHRVRLLALFASLAFLAGCGVSSEYEDAASAFEERDYETAFSIFLPLAEGGNVNAQFIVGSMYGQGQGVAQNKQQAAVWYRKAAEQGDADAQARLGLVYRDGDGVPKDDQQAVVWLSKAAEQGHANAKLTIGQMYEYGNGAPQDYELAAAWYRKAAEQGSALGQQMLGRMYEGGLGMPKDDQQAYFWLLLASGAGEPDSFRRRDLVEARLTPDQRAEAQAQAREWKPTRWK